MDGYIYNFKVYAGKSDAVEGESHSLHVIKGLMENLTGKGRIIYADNYCNSIDTNKYLLLKETNIWGTGRSNRKLYQRTL